MGWDNRPLSFLALVGFFCKPYRYFPLIADTHRVVAAGG